MNCCKGVLQVCRVVGGGGFLSVALLMGYIFFSMCETIMLPDVLLEENDRLNREHFTLYEILWDGGLLLGLSLMCCFFGAKCLGFDWSWRIPFTVTFSGAAIVFWKWLPRFMDTRSEL